MKDMINNWAKDLGFAACGFTTVEPLESEREQLSQWLVSNYHAEMHYMENHFEKRVNPSLLVENSKTIITLLHSYYPEQLQDSETTPLIAKYAYGEDYHIVLKEKMQELWDKIERSFGPITGRMFTDSAPILERPLAVRSGLGWIGKNSLLINKEFGSFLFISEIILDLEIEPDLPFTQNYCGTCRKCIENCPTSAIIENGVIDSSRCLSYQTIENRGIIPPEIAVLNKNQMYGCDICQDVCPWNRKSTPTTEPRFAPHPDLLTYTKSEWAALTEEEYRRIFRNSAVKRAKFSGLKRNIEMLISPPSPALPSSEES